MRPRTDPYRALRGVLAPEYAELPPEELERTLDGMFGEGAAEDLENFWRTLKRVGRGAGQVLQKAAPIIGTVAGTAFGGPVGAALGGAAGKALSGALGGAMRGQSAGRIASGALSGALSGVAGGAARGGAGGLMGGAASQLLGVLRRPETLQALMGMALGPAGRRSVPVAGRPVPAAAFTNLLGVLANQAAAEHHAATAADSGGVPSYLLDAAGEFIVDPTDPAQRAEVLLGRLAAAEILESRESEDRYERHEVSWDPEQEEALALEALYDEMELAEAEEL